MNCKTYKIGKRITLAHIKTDKFKKARLTFTFTLPIDRESTYINSMLMPIAFLGTEKYPDFRSVCLAAEELYASDMTDINLKLGNFHIIGIHASMLNDDYISEADKSNGFSVIKGVLGIISQLILHPSLRDEDVETERVNQIRRIRSRRNDAFGYAKYRFARTMFENDPSGCSLIGEEEQVSTVNAACVRSQLVEILKNAPIEIFYCGSCDADKVISLVKSEFPELVSDENFASSLQRRSFPRSADAVRLVEESGEYRQGNLLVGFRTGTFLSDREFYATELMNQIYGDGASSKLFANLREQKALCYFCASSYDEVRGIIVVGCGINNSDFKNALDEILFQLDEIKNGHFTDEELSAARKTIISDCRAAKDHPGDYEAFGRTYRLFGGPFDIDEYKRGILEVTKEEISEAAKRLTLDTVYFLKGNLEGGEPDDE